MHPQSLVPGNCYFHVTYLDDNLSVPSVDTLIYRGCETDEDGERYWMFEAPAGMFDEVNEEPSGENDEQDSDETPFLVAFQDKALHRILEIDGLIKTLSERAEDHPITPPPARQSPIGVNENEAERLRSNIEKFLNNDDWYSVTITISYTDDGLSLGRKKGGGFEIGFFTEPKFDPSEDIRLFELFAEIGTSPHVDYLADHGRTRVLEFAISDSPAEIFDLCVRVLTEVHRNRRDDALKISFLPKDSTDGSSLDCDAGISVWPEGR